MHPAIRKVIPLFQAPRCEAKTRTGAPCQSPAVREKRRCRMHGGASGSGAPKGERNGRYRHGQFTCDALEERRRTRALMAQMQAFADDILER
nr:HGGxSTG domain-containing protein [Microvirga sp. HBU67558]